jgi:putative methylase
MKKKQLEIFLERLEGFQNPALEREQYMTPASVAAELLHLAHLRGELKSVCDLGYGTRILAIGAALLGAKAVGVDLDPEALEIARANASKLGVYVEFICGDVSSIALRKIETVVMNPPFGAQKASIGDRAFLRKATEIAHVIYTLQNVGSEGFIKRFIEPCAIEEKYSIRFPIKRCFEFHRKDIKTIDVELYRILCQ